jgi:hypothetical protein
MEATRRGGGECNHGGVSLRLLDARRVKGARLPWGTARHDYTQRHEYTSMTDLAMLIDGQDAGPEGMAGAAREDAEVVCVLKFLDEHDVTDVKQRCQLRDREVPHAPSVLKLVRDASVHDEAPPRQRGFVHHSQGFDE